VYPFPSMLNAFRGPRRGAAIVLSLAIAGCSSIGPGTLPRDRTDYLTALSTSWKVQTLSNVVHIRYGDTPSFLDVSSIVSAYTLETNATAGVTLNSMSLPASTVLPYSATVLGADNYLMACCHVAHDCRTGDGVTIANGALLAGCVTLGDRVFVSGNVTIHQFVHVGELSMIGGLSRVSKDVPPYMLVVGDSKVCGVNVIGMRRASMTADDRRAVRRVYGILYRSGLAMSRAIERLRAEPSSPVVDAFVAFMAASTRGLCAPRQTRSRRKTGAPADA